jgi:exosortase
MESKVVALIPVFIIQLVFIFSYLAEIETLQYASLILTLLSLVYYNYGYQYSRALLFPLFFLIFMVPIPSQIYSELTISLQLFVTKTSVVLIKWIDIPTYREGNIIHIPEMRLQVVEACSGLRSMISLITLSVFYAYISFKKFYKRTILSLSAIPAAVFINIVRIITMVIGIHFYNINLTVGRYHEIFGVVIFGLGIACIVLAKGILKKCVN